MCDRRYGPTLIPTKGVLIIKQFPKEEVKDLHKELMDIQEKLHQKGIAEDERALVERYADMLLETADNATATPQKLVTGLLTRCLLWVELIEQRQVDRYTS